MDYSDWWLRVSIILDDRYNMRISDVAVKTLEWLHDRGYTPGDAAYYIWQCE